MKKQIALMQKAFLSLSCIQTVMFGIYVPCILVPFPSVWTALFAVLMIVSIFMCLFASGVLPAKGEEEES